MTSSFPRSETSDGPSGAETALTRRIRERWVETWGERHSIPIVGRHPILLSALERAARFAESDSPVLITGETGTGKEMFARAIYLLSRRSNAPFISVNCAQYHEGQLVASELFGHKKGSFTGAVSDHQGIFEAVNGGVVFLDEIGELSAAVQGMLLRALGEGEIVPVGDTRSRRVNMRVIAATNRNLRTLVQEGRFRQDLYYRLRFLQLEVPPLRARGDDWELIVEYYLGHLGEDNRRRKTFSSEAREILGSYDWPGNVRELRALVDTGFHLAESDLIEPHHFIECLEEAARAEQLTKIPLMDRITGRYEQMRAGAASFWEVVHGPYMRRELSRSEVKAIVARGLAATGGSYKKLLATFGVPGPEYLRFMDFLRHHRLKPAR